MNISEGFIKRPIATSLLMAAIALFGLVAYRSLPVSDLPNVDFPTLLVTAQLPGASPETMGASVATPLENQFSMIAGLESMTSVNSLGSTQITLEFDLNRSLDGAAVDVQGAITQAARLLPQGMPTPPTFTKVNPADQPILYLVITSTTVPPWTLDEYAETRIAQRISMVSGVAQVQVLGSQKFAVHAQLDPHALAARQIGINEVEASLRAWNVNTPTGSIIGPHKTFTLQATGQLMSASEYQNMIVTYRNGAPVRLGELGTIKDGVEDERTASWFYTKEGEQRAITLGIQRQPGTNTIEVADAVKALMPQFKLELPSSIHMDVLYDRSDTIRESYRDVQFTMVLTLALVIMVIFVFLRNVWATVIPSLALPFSIIGTFAVMYMLGLQPRQPVDDGADPVGRLRRGRRHRDAREHLPPRRNGRGSVVRVARRVAGDRLHDRLDDALAGRGVHPGPVHGWRAGTPLPRVLGHDLRRHPHLGCRVGDADADAL
jgi:HAE1 family hydrophobic/amphiphilic exporter-1